MRFAIHRAAVIGAGTMGAAIAAHLANAGIPCDLLDVAPAELTPEEKAAGLALDHPGVRNRIVNAGWERCLKARPSNLFTPDRAELVTTGNLEDHLERLARADWIIEAVIERLEVKQQLLARLEAVRKPGSIVSTNTSGLPIGVIAEGRSDEFKAHFLGTHFFNPPRYLKLLELIPHAQTAPAVVRFMREFGARALGKGVVVARDTPNFIANRLMAIGSRQILNYALAHGYSVAEVDALTGPLIGHPKTATFRLFDLIGVDVIALVSEHLYPALTYDPFREELRQAKSTVLLKAMTERGWLGNKARQGFYKQVDTPQGRQFWTLNLETWEHQPSQEPASESAAKHEDVPDTGERVRRLCAESDRAGQFIWATTAFALNYAASVLPEIAGDILSIDNASQWGFNHELGPFELWDALGVAESVARMEAEGMPVAGWVKEMLAAGHPSFYRRDAGHLAYYDSARRDYVPVEPDPRAVILKNVNADSRRVAAENASASLLDLGEGVLCVEFHSKANAIDAAILSMMNRARDELEGDWAALVIGNQGEHFCAGANVALIAGWAEAGEWEKIEALIKGGQDNLMSFRACPKPVIAAPFGMALGGGAEVMMGASAICAHAEAYIGQAEAGVGLIPAAGGCKELLRRLITPVVKTNPRADVLPYLQQAFELIAQGKVSGSAEEARQWGFLATQDRITLNRDHLLGEARRMALEMIEAGWRPPSQSKDIWAAGANGLAMLEIIAWTWREAGYASEHDVLVARKAAHILCGGRLARPQWVEAQHILDLEREAFLSLLGEPKTIERIRHMLKTGRVLRN